MSRLSIDSSLPALSLGLVASAQGWMVWFDWPGVLPGLFYISLWLALIAVADPWWEPLNTRAQVPPAPGRRRSSLPFLVTVVYAALACAFAAVALRLLVSSAAASAPPVVDSRVHLVGAALFFTVYFLRHYWDHDAGRRGDPAPAWRLLLGLLALQSLAGLLSPDFPAFSAVASRLFAFLALYLPLEWLASLAFRAFQPPSRRASAPFRGRSLLLDTLLGGRSPLVALAVAVHGSLGFEVRGTWVSRALRAWFEPVALFFVLGLWLSGSAVVVPLGHEGVLAHWGRFQAETLGPGLHLVAPWPIERVRLVPVARVDAFSLGFDADLGGPLLWAEPHFSGERNLLVGDGEQALTFNVPVQFSRADALAAERAGPFAERILSHLAYRELLLATARRDAFAIMTADRERIAAGLRRGLQTAADRLSLGTCVHFVGLKDIHPAVEVAPAFQEVISAREQGRMMVELARANRLTALAEARSDADRARRTSEGAALERAAAVAGEAARLTGKVDARLASPDWFDFESRLTLAESIVPRLRLFLVRGDPAKPAPLTFDLREGTPALTP